MIFAFSTSSRLASVAALDAAGEVLWAGALDAPQSASSACMQLLWQAREEAGLNVEDGTLFVADLGPGSFTGVRVGIVLAKTLGFLFDRPCAGADAFDLVATDRVVVLPVKRGEYFVRRPGEPPFTSISLPWTEMTGYGPPDLNPTYPSAAGFGPLVRELVLVRPDELAPRYLIEPSISIPKKAIPGVNA